MKNNNKYNTNSPSDNKPNSNKESNICMVVPYTKGFNESFKNIYSKHGIQVYFKGSNIIKNLLVAPKDKDIITQKGVVNCRHKCDIVECNKEYIGESARTFGEIFKEHLKAPSWIYGHSDITGHHTRIGNSSMGEEKHRTSLNLQKKLYSYEWMIHL